MVDRWMMQYVVYALPSVYSTRCMLYSVLTLHQGMVWETGTAYIAVLADGRVQHAKERDEKRWGKSSWAMGTERILCVSQFTIPNTAGRSPDLVFNYTAMRSSQLNLSNNTPEFSHSLASSTSFSSSSLHPSHSRPLQSSQITKLSHPSLSLHAMIMSWHPVQAYTEYSIHWAQHTPSPAYTEYSIPMFVCLPFILMITSWPLNVASAPGVPPYTINGLQLSRHEHWNVKSPCHIPTILSP